MSKNRIISIMFLLFGILLSFNVLYTPIPNTESTTDFNTKYAMEYISEFSEKEHSVFDTDNHEEVRVYLKEKLTEFIGSENVYEYNYTKDEFEEEIEYDVKNLLGIIPGKSDTAILIVAHYDSRGHIGRTGELGNSYGAADDGYGIALMLEIARLYGEKELENTIYLLMTDAEETGLYGAKKAKNEPFMDNVGFIINIEARGVDGPAYMFETSTNNEKVIDFYTNANLPVSYSLATAVYTVMPNYTDFTEFLDVEKNGINFAVLKGLYYYHTPHDNYTNINPSSIEHYATQIMPLVDEFTMNEEYGDVDYFESNSDKVFFTLYKDVFINYNENSASFIHVSLLLIAIGVTILLLVKKEISIKRVLISEAIMFISLFCALLIGFFVSKLIANITKVPFVITYVRTTIGDIPSLFILMSLTLILYYLYNKKTSINGIRKSIIVVGTLINLVLALITGFVLSGASFLFLIPGLSGLILLLLMQFCQKDIVKQIVLGILLIVNLLVLLPILYSLYLALTVGGLLALCAILVFYLVVVIPVYTELYNM